MALERGIGAFFLSICAFLFVIGTISSVICLEHRTKHPDRRLTKASMISGLVCWLSFVVVISFPVRTLVFALFS